MLIGIVEDDPDLNELYRTGLLLAGHESRGWYNAVDALRDLLGLKLNREKLPEVVVVDLNLPGGIDGAELIKRLREEIAPQEVQFVLMSGNDLAEQRLKERHILDVPFFKKTGLTPSALLKECKKLAKAL